MRHKFNGTCPLFFRICMLISTCLLGKSGINWTELGVLPCREAAYDRDYYEKYN